MKKTNKEKIEKKAEHLMNLKLNKTEAIELATKLVDDEEKQEFNKILNEKETTHSIDEILNDLKVFDVYNELQFNPSKFYHVKDYKLIANDGMFDTIMDIQNTYKTTKSKYNESEWHCLFALNALYNYTLSGKYDKEKHSLIKHKLNAHLDKLEIVSFKGMYENICHYLEWQERGFYHIDSNIVELLKVAKDEYKLNCHKNAGKKMLQNVILQIDAKTNEIIERYSCVGDVIEYNEGYTKNGLSMALTGKRSRYKGFVWKYAE